MTKKAQMKIQEMAFVLLALVLLAIIAFVFFIRFQSTRIERAGEEAKQQAAVSLLDKIASLQELSCSEGEICVDEDKAMIIKKYDTSSLFQGIKKARIVRIYPSGEDIILYEAGEGQESYSTFINLCKQDKTGISFEYECGIAMLVLSY